MEYSFKNIYKFKLPVTISSDSGSTKGYGFVHKNGNQRYLSNFPQKDFYLPVFITRTGNLLEYVDINIDQTEFIIPRQEVNPYYIEFEFFDTIKRNKVNTSADLTTLMINFIRSERPEISLLYPLDNDGGWPTYNDGLKSWFDKFGKYEFPWDGNITIDDIDKVALVNENIISKAFFMKIDINK